MLFKGLYTLLLAATAALAIETQEETIKNIVVFGDSYSDVGNKQRLTNGPLWSEHLAVGWNASLYSFAFSGAVCDNGMYPEQPSSESYIPSIIDQVEMYYKQNLQLNMKETAIVFWVGVNDVYKVFEKNEDTTEEFKKVVQCIGINIRNLRKVFSSNKFIVFGVPPLEHMPFYANTELAPSREQAANDLNEQLTKEVEKMNKHLQLLELDLVDVHRLIDDIVEHPELFNIKNAREAYWDACQGQCTDDMDAYVWWDKTHLTGGVHRLIANSILMAGSLAPATVLGDEVDVNALLEDPNSHYKSPVYLAKKNTGEINKIINKMNADKLAKDQDNISSQDNMSGKHPNPDRASKTFIYFGITATVIVCIGFVLFVKSKRRGNQLAALSGLLQNKPERGRFMPLRNMDSEV